MDFAYFVCVCVRAPCWWYSSFRRIFQTFVCGLKFVSLWHPSSHKHLCLPTCLLRSKPYLLMLFLLLLTLAIFVEIYTYFFSVVDAIFNQRNALITGRANMGDVDNNHYIKIFFHTYHFTSLLASDVVLFCFLFCMQCCSSTKGNRHNSPHYSCRILQWTYNSAFSLKSFSSFF